MSDLKVYGFEMAKIAEVYLSTLSEMMAPYGIDRNFVAFIFLCENSGKVTQNDLAKRLNQDKVSAMRVVDYFCDRDLLERIKDETDKRCYLLTVKEKALELLPIVKAAVQQTNEIILENLNKSELECFSRAMDLIKNKIKSLPDSDFVVEAYKRNIINETDNE